MARLLRERRLIMHLSTAIMLMFVAGALLWANTAPSVLHLKSRGNLSRPGRDALQLYGWPLPVNQYTIIGSMGTESASEHGWNNHIVIFDAVIALAILFAVWFVCEWWIRRRAAQKGNAA